MYSLLETILMLINLKLFIVIFNWRYIRAHKISNEKDDGDISEVVELYVTPEDCLTSINLSKQLMVIKNHKYIFVDYLAAGKKEIGTN